jgi:hypothetical protein
MKLLNLTALVAAVGACSLLAGCGGGGGGGGPAPIPPGTFTADATGGSPFRFSPNVMGAIASGSRVEIYADQRTGPINAYDSSKRLSLTLYGPVAPGTFPIATSHASGTSAAVYVETVKQNGIYVQTGVWQATTGSITVNAADGRHVEGSFTLSTRNSKTNGVISFQNGRFSVNYETPPPPPA